MRAALAVVLALTLPTCPRRAALSADQTRIEVRAPIVFDIGKAQLRPASFPVLDEVAELLRAQPTLALDIRTHGLDERDRAMRLTQRRAEEVRAYLIARGVAPDRLQAHGYGDAVPLVPWTQKDARRINIRTELVVLPPPPPPPPPSLPPPPMPRLPWP